MSELTAELHLSQPPAFLNRSGRYVLTGPAGAVEIANCRGGGPTWLSHSATNRYGDDSCECDLLPSGVCWPDSGTVYPGADLDAYRAGDAAVLEASLRRFYANTFTDPGGVPS